MTDSATVPEPRVFRLSRRMLILGVAALAGVLGIVVWLVTRTPAPARARSIGARLELAAGDVAVSENKASSKALSGTPLAIGSHIATGKGSRALVRTGDGAAVFLRGETEIVLDDKGLTIESGEVWLDAPKVDNDAIEVALGKHTLSASDSGLSITRKGDEVTVYVARGLSILTSPGGRVEINQGEQGIIHATEAPKVSAVKFWQDWTGGMGDSHASHGAMGSGSGRIYGLDPGAPPGAPAKKLGIAQQSVRAVVRDGIAETEVDQTFSNPGSQSIEGWYWFTIPPQAIVTSFALETDGHLVEGEVIERREAAARYQAAVTQAKDPALLEWVDGRTYRARIFPIPQSGTRRVVLRYMETLPRVDGKVRYVYPMRSDDPPRFDEFALSVDLGDIGPKVQVSTSLDARVESGGRLVSMRRSGYVPRADFQLEMGADKKAPAVRAWRFEAGTDKADYVMMRYVPEVDFAALPPAKGELVVVVDTSAGGDEAARALRMSAAEAILRALSDDDRFALVALDVAPTVVYPKDGLAQATDGDISKALEKLSDHAVGGATDLGAMFEPALERLHNTEQPAVVYVGDGAATSGETSSDALLERLRRSLTGTRARLFAVGVGADARHDLLGQLTRAGGGQYLRIDEGDQTTGQALRLTSAIKTPTITDLDIDIGAGLDQPFYSATGKLTRGEELLLLARTHHPLPQKVKVKGRVGGKPFDEEYPLTVESGVTTSLVPRLWAAEYTRRLLGSGGASEDNRGKVLDLGVEYGLMTPYTSILALDSESAYARQGIPRRKTKLRGERLTAITSPEKEHELAALYAPTFPMTAMGCDKRSASASHADDMEQQGGTGARAKGEEGSMGNPSPPTAQVAAVPQAGPREATFADGDRKEDSIPSAPGSPPPSDPNGNLKLSAGGSPIAAGNNGAGLTGIGGGGGGANKPVATPPAPRRTGPAGAKTAPKAVMKDGRDLIEEKQLALDADRTRANALSALRPAWPAIPRASLSRCSDAAARPLAERIVLWQKRAKKAQNAYELVSQYEMARASCELPDWRDQAALLDLLQQRVDTEGGAEYVLGHFAGETDAQRFVARSILRRTVDLHLAAAVGRVLFGSNVDWQKVDRDLLDTDKADARLGKLKVAMAVAPGDPSGDVRYVRLLAQLDQKQEAIAYGRRLRDRGFLTPTLAQQLGDVLSSAGEKDEALRTYSEIVEFDGGNPASRRVLGDIFLRQGWYAAAYRQYKTLTDLDPKGQLPRLRLAAAAAGAGRTDEALRIERDVATGEGNPGPNDPRYWARLWSAARIGALMSEQGAPAASKDALARKLKELQLFSGPGALSLVSWEDLDVAASLVNADEKKDTLPGEVTDATPTGLYALLVRPEVFAKTNWAVRWKSEPLGRALAYKVTTLSWDGRDFKVAIKSGELKPGDRQIAL